MVLGLLIESLPSVHVDTWLGGVLSKARDLL